MQWIRTTWSLSVACLMLATACGSDSAAGRLELRLTTDGVPTDIETVAYVIECDSGFTLQGDLEVLPDQDPPVWAEVMGVPEGTCVVTLMANDPSETTICTGSTMVTVLEGQSVKATITLRCTSDGPATGDIEIDGEFREIVVDTCPVIHVLNAIRSDIPDGQRTAMVEFRVSDYDGDPVTTDLTADSGTIEITDPSAVDAIFTCPGSGNDAPHSVTGTVTSGDNAACDASTSIMIQCPPQGGTGGTGGGGGTGGTGGTGGPGGACEGYVPPENPLGLCLGVDCNDNNECTMDVCDTPSGVCNHPPEIDGDPCNHLGILDGVCRDGKCGASFDRCEGVVCDDSEECTQDRCESAFCIFQHLEDGTPCGDGGSCRSGACKYD